MSGPAQLLEDSVDDAHSLALAASAVELSLVARIRAGDCLAEDELINTYRRGVLVIATARTRDREAARDLAQEVLIAVLKALREGQ